MFTVLKSFSGKVSGSKGHVIELKDKAIISDLLKAGYIEEYTEKLLSEQKGKPQMRIKYLKNTLSFSGQNIEGNFKTQQ